MFYSLTTFIGKDVIFKALSKSTGGIIRSINYLIKQEIHPPLEQELKKLDLIPCISVFAAIAQEEKELDNSLHIALNYVHTTIADINKLLHEIQTEIKQHEQKWFATWRTPDVYSNLDQVKELKVLLDKRIKLFIQIVQFQKN
jgi:BMFP domain-containing protein YqiC